jgi:hypothetical protein
VVNVQEWIVVGRDDIRDVDLVEAQIRSLRVGPPGIERRLVELCPMAIVVEPQTEARAT